MEVGIVFKQTQNRFLIRHASERLISVLGIKPDYNTTTRQGSEPHRAATDVLRFQASY
jgi:hypothetical protein